MPVMFVDVSADVTGVFCSFLRIAIGFAMAQSRPVIQFVKEKRNEASKNHGSCNVRGLYGRDADRHNHSKRRT
jgi:hypothetical protein